MKPDITIGLGFYLKSSGVVGCLTSFKAALSLQVKLGQSSSRRFSLELIRYGFFLVENY